MRRILLLGLLGLLVSVVAIAAVAFAVDYRTKDMRESTCMNLEQAVEDLRARVGPDDAAVAAAAEAKRDYCDSTVRRVLRIS